MVVNSSEFRKKLKSKLLRRERVFGGWVSYREAAIAETFAKADFDFVAIDMEHTTITTDQANRIITGVQAESCTCLPRPVSHNNDFIKPLLEAGADGLIIPVVNNQEDAQRQVQLQKYPPLGQRSYGVNRAHGYGFDFDSYTRGWNETGVFIAQIETITAVNNIEQILDTAGLDAVMIGPYDIAGSLGVPGETDHVKVRKAAQKVIKKCEDAGISCMTQISKVSRVSVQDAFDQGYTAIVMSSDLFVLWHWATEMRDLVLEMRR